MALVLGRSTKGAHRLLAWRPEVNAALPTSTVLRTLALGNDALVLKDPDTHEVDT